MKSVTQKLRTRLEGLINKLQIDGDKIVIWRQI
jgi:hypothetical protein